MVGLLQGFFFFGASVRDSAGGGGGGVVVCLWPCPEPPVDTSMERSGFLHSLYY